MLDKNWTCTDLFDCLKEQIIKIHKLISQKYRGTVLYCVHAEVIKEPVLSHVLRSDCLSVIHSFQLLVCN